MEFSLKLFLIYYTYTDFYRNNKYDNSNTKCQSNKHSHSTHGKELIKRGNQINME